MEPAIAGALAALAGSAIGAIAPVTSNYLIQRGQTQRELVARTLGLRQTLYSDFIKAGAKLYAVASLSSLDQLDEVIDLYALIGRMRLVASTPVVEAADQFVRLIVRRFGEANMTVEDFRAAALESHADPLKDFSSKCREEMQRVLVHPS